MFFIIGTIGFLGGFILGQIILAYLLRHRSRDDLITDKALHWKYGLLNWVLAILTAACAVFLYDRYFF